VPLGRLERLDSATKVDDTANSNLGVSVRWLLPGRRHAPPSQAANIQMGKVRGSVNRMLRSCVFHQERFRTHREGFPDEFVRLEQKAGQSFGSLSGGRGESVSERDDPTDAQLGPE